MVRRNSCKVQIIEHPEYAEQQKTQDALKTIEEIKSFFDPNSPDSWPLLSEIVGSADKFKIRGWNEPAAYLNDLMKNIKLEPDKAIIENVDTILQFCRKGTLQNIDSSLEKIVDYQDKIESSRDPILVKLDNIYVTGQAAAATDVNELDDKLIKIVELNKKITEFIEGDWQTEIDQETFLRAKWLTNIDSLIRLFG